MTTLGRSHGALAAYPHEIIGCIEEVVTWLQRNLPVSRVLLLGSTARGELSWRELDCGLDVFSDLEFYVLTHRPLSSAEKRDLSMARADWRRTWPFPSPFFHIDTSVNTEALFWWKLRYDRRIPSYELIQNSVILVGRDFDRMAHSLDVSRLDMGATNELVLTRLWMQLLLTPSQVLEQTASDYVWMTFKFALCRNILDVLTIFLPNVGILLPSYRHRLDFLLRHPELQKHLPPGTATIQSMALEAKLHVHVPREAAFYYQAFLSQYLGLLRYLLGLEVLDTLVTPDRIARVITKLLSAEMNLFADATLPRLRRLRREIRMARAYAGEVGWRSVLSWLFRDKRPHIVASLLYLHYGLAEILSAGRTDVLPKALDLLRQVDPVCAVPRAQISRGDMSAWLALRSALIGFMSVWYYNDPGYIEQWGVLDWRYDDA